MVDKNDNKDVLELERVFNAPIERVLEAWTQPEVLVKWFSPERDSVNHSGTTIC